MTTNQSVLTTKNKNTFISRNDNVTNLHKYIMKQINIIALVSTSDVISPLARAPPIGV